MARLGCLLRRPLQSVSRAVCSVHVDSPRAASMRALAASPRLRRTVPPHRLFSTTLPGLKGLSPESEDPPVPQARHQAAAPATPADISEAQYHELADEYLEAILSKFEDLQDEREDVDVEYAAGVLTVSFPPIGTYVINKQPPNKQIWLSSPRTGPKRYDWVVIGDGQAEKQGTGAGSWVYLRDGSTLDDLFLSEMGLQVDDVPASRAER